MLSSINFAAGEEVEVPVYHENLDLENIIMPIRTKKLIAMLKEVNYNREEIQFLKQGFSQGFNIEYEGPKNRQSTAPNLHLHVGSKVQLWNKLMKEVKCQRVAGPFEDIPFDNFIQSPIGLVPKAGGDGNQTRLIFHLSYEFK